MIVAGAWSLQYIDIDAFPDTTPVMVQINTTAPSLSPEEVERQITFPIEQSISGLPGLEKLRSISKFGLSQVVVIFEDGTDIYFARQLINERLTTVELPAGIERPKMGPVSTGLGEVFHYIVRLEGVDISALPKERQVEEADGTAHDSRLGDQAATAHGQRHGGSQQLGRLRETVPGAHRPGPPDQARIDVRRSGRGRRGEQPQCRRRQHHAEQPDAAGPRHRPHGQHRADRKHRHQGQGRRARSAFATSPTCRSATKSAAEPSPPTAGAKSSTGWASCSWARTATKSPTSSKKRWRRSRPRCRPASRSIPVYDRTELVDHVIETVQKNLFEGGLLVIAVLFMFLGNLRAGLIVALAIPLSMLFAFSGMLRFGIAASLLSLGAIDFGLVVDSSVVMIENCVRKLSHGIPQGQTKIDVVRDAAVEVRKPTMFGELIIMIVYLPILTLEGVEGKLFRPMALTVIFALGRFDGLVADADAGAGQLRPAEAHRGTRAVADSLDQTALSARSCISRCTTSWP